jgi:hypothetical protein
MKEQIQNLQIGTSARNALLLFVVIGLFCSLFPFGNALAQVQQKDPEQYLFLPAQNYQQFFIVIEKTKRQENIFSTKNPLLNAPFVNPEQVRFAAQIFCFSTPITPSSVISNLLYTQTTSSCL